MPSRPISIISWMRRRIEIGHQRRDEGVVRLVRDGGGFGAVVVAGETQHAAVLGRAGRIAVAEDVAAAVDAGALAVPDADHAVVLRRRARG